MNKRLQKSLSKLKNVASWGAGPCCHGRGRNKCTLVDEWQSCKDLKGVFHENKNCSICQQVAFTGIVIDYPPDQ
jgi:hypothetical protein